MKKLIEEYQKIIYEDKETLQNIKNAYKNMIPVTGPIPDRTFFTFTTSNLIKESELNNSAIKLINLIKNGSNVFTISFDEILKNVNVNWRFYSLLQKTKYKFPIIVVYFDFSYPDKNLILGLSKAGIKIPEENIDQHLKYFKENYEKINGALLTINSCCLMILNTGKDYKFSNETIEHELYHYFQTILHINTVKEKDKDKTNGVLGFTLSNLKYIFNEKEFLTHLTVDLAKQLATVWLKNKHELNQSAIDFFNSYIKDVETAPNKIMQSDIAFLFSKAKIDDNGAFRLLPACKILDERHLYKVGIKELKKAYLNYLGENNK
ncbi:MAG: hypothetical protein J6J11_00305 [Treponema sp.]|nr:hypothetical protein [Clostridia bacterium]MBP3606753.1 hypothetical protein [Treponema sp.]